MQSMLKNSKLKHSRLGHRNETLGDVLKQKIQINAIATFQRQLMRRFAESVQLAFAIAREMAELSKLLDVPFTIPASPIVNAADIADAKGHLVEDLNARLDILAEELAAQWDSDRIGQITWTDNDTASITYYTVHKQRGLMRTTKRIVRSRHDIVQARIHKVSSPSVKKPRRARQLISRMHHLRDVALIVTGMQVVDENQHVATETQPTALANALRSTADGLKRHGGKIAVGAGGLAAAGLIGVGIAKAMAAAAVVAVADPGLVIGDKCLIGWTDE